MYVCLHVRVCVGVSDWTVSRRFLWSDAESNVTGWSSHLVSKVRGERQTGGHSEVRLTSGHLHID